MTLRSLYRRGGLTPTRVINAIYDRIEARKSDHAWIYLISREEALQRASWVEQRVPRSNPFYGVPFAVKDNFDVPGLPTTCGCPATKYIADRAGLVMTKLLESGCILIGKTNMDQFAIGLVGARSPYGACSSVFNDKYISGGSSSGSAVAVAAGLVSFAMGNDAAGSGRVPAAFNNIVGLKPTPGLVSNSSISKG